MLSTGEPFKEIRLTLTQDMKLKRFLFGSRSALEFQNLALSLIWEDLKPAFTFTFDMEEQILDFIHYKLCVIFKTMVESGGAKLVSGGLYEGDIEWAEWTEAWLEKGWDGDVKKPKGPRWMVAEGERGREWLVVDPEVTKVVSGVDGEKMVIYMDE